MLPLAVSSSPRNSGVEGGIYIRADIEPVRFPAAGNGRELPQLGVGGGFQTLNSHIHLSQELGNQTTLLLQQSKKQMHLLHLLIAVLNGKTLGVLDSLQRFLRVILKIHSHPSFPGFSTL